MGLLETAITAPLSIQSAREQMRFQFMMSNTAMQRGVRDLRKAGLNPILAASGGLGASTPGGAMANIGASGDIIGSALAARRQHQEIKNMKATEGLSGEQAGLAVQGVKTAKSQEALNNAATARMVAETGKIGAETKITEAKLPREQWAEDLYQTPWGKALLNIDAVSRALQGAGGGAGAVRSGFETRSSQKPRGRKPRIRPGPQ